MKQIVSKIRVAGIFVFAAFLMLANRYTVYGTDIGNSKLAKGTEKLISDATTWLMVLAPVVAGLMIIYFWKFELHFLRARMTMLNESV